MRKRLTLLSALTIIFLLVFRPFLFSESGQPGHSKNKEDYNVILIIIDDLRPDHLGCYGYRKQVSPAIDRIAKDSVIFENAFSQAAYTLASTMSIFTSLYPSSHGVRFIFKDTLAPHIKTLPELFELYGYYTAWFSLLKSPHLDIDIGFGRGFQEKGELAVPLSKCEQVFSWLEKNKNNKFFLAMDARRVHDFYCFSRQLSFRGSHSHSEDKDIYNPPDTVERIFYRTIVQIAHSGRFPLDDPAIVLEHKELFDGRYSLEKIQQIKELLDPAKRGALEAMRDSLFTSWLKRTASFDTKAWIAAYDKSIISVDQELIRPIEEKLKEAGIYDKTIIVITADHGEAFGEHGFYGHGFQLFDEFNRVPLVIKAPYAKKGKKIKELVQCIDIMPTLLEFAGIPIPHQAQGKSLIGFITGEEKTQLHEYIFAESPDVKEIRSLEWKLIVRDEVFPQDKWLLFDLKRDPKEKHNLYSKNRGLFLKLNTLLQQWESSLPVYKDKENPFSPKIDQAAQERIRKTGYW